MQAAQSERSVKPLQIASKVRILLCPFRRRKMGDISVIIPVYNGAKTIERALASLISNKKNIAEIIVVDDYCDDNTVDLVRQYYKVFQNLRIVRSNGFHNPGLARKTGMINASGKWITFLDADDCLTASSLRYVSNKLSDGTLLLCCKTIYYESGNFDANTIEYSDTSCGGNFYNRGFMINNNIYPNDELKLVEDEYFNEKTIKLIEASGGEIEHYDYPVYEVHHDIGDGFSYALSNWVDYLCKYRLLYKQRLVDDLYDVVDNHELKTEYINNIIFCYFLAEGLMLDKDVSFSFDENKKHFNQAIKYYETKFNDIYYSIIFYFEKHEELVESIWQSAIESIGFEFDDYLNFRRFIKDCL